MPWKAVWFSYVGVGMVWKMRVGMVWKTMVGSVSEIGFYLKKEGRIGSLDKLLSPQYNTIQYYNIVIQWHVESIVNNGYNDYNIEVYCYNIVMHFRILWLAL